jgi:hypothetical protein
VLREVLHEEGLNRRCDKGRCSGHGVDSPVA